MVTRDIAKQLLGTAAAVLGGWIAALLFCGALYVFGPSHQREPVDAGLLFGSTIAMSWFMAWFIVPVWVLILIPLYLFLPLRSALWRWPVCTACGALAGFLIMAFFFGGIPGFGQLSSGAWDFYILAAIIGSITCLIGSLTKHMFKPTI
ncbi:MAG: hypothetical protein ABIT38_22860 [Gemmatimonadaceae bacterium]